MTKEELEKEAREQAKKIEENQTLGVYDRDEDLEYDKGYNAGEVSGYQDGYIAGAERREKLIAEIENYNKKLLEGDIDKQNKIALLSKKVNDLQKENAELKGEANSVLDNWCRGDDPCPHLKKRDNQLIKAKELLNEFNRVLKEHSFYHNELYKRTEQFISEVEK